MDWGLALLGTLQLVVAVAVLFAVNRVGRKPLLLRGETVVSCLVASLLAEAVNGHPYVSLIEGCRELLSWGEYSTPGTRRCARLLSLHTKRGHRIPLLPQVLQRRAACVSSVRCRPNHLTDLFLLSCTCYLLWLLLVDLRLGYNACRRIMLLRNSLLKKRTSKLPS